MAKISDTVLHTYDEERLVTKHDKAAKRGSKTANKTVVGKHLTVSNENGKITLTWDWEALHREVVEAIASVSEKPAAKKPATKKSAAKKSATKKTATK